MSYKFSTAKHGPPRNAVDVGCALEPGQKWLYTVLVDHPQHGTIGGKAIKDKAWYTHEGHEHDVQTFRWLAVKNGMVSLVRNSPSNGKPAETVSFGEEDGEERFAALAITEFGLIPGKAKGDSCWYGYNGTEYITEDFLWLVCLKDNWSNGDFQNCPCFSVL